MIVTDPFYLRQKSDKTSPAFCTVTKLFKALEYELKQSKRPGVGLAAIQIGTLVRACIIRLEKLELDMINPKIIDQATLKVFQQEGCLSLPGVYLDTDRYQDITATWFCPKENKQRTGEFHGLEAVVLQHEIDHMDGILILSRRHRKQEKIGRNDPCPCGSGKKYKKCCGK